VGAARQQSRRGADPQYLSNLPQGSERSALLQLLVDALNARASNDRNPTGCNSILLIPADNLRTQCTYDSEQGDPTLCISD